MADEGDFSFDGYGAIRAWLDRIAAQPRHVLLTVELSRLNPSG